MISTGKYPELWKMGVWTPIFKNGDKSCFENYRCVAVLCGLNQVIEKLLHEQLFAYMLKYLNEKQHGFRCGKSTLTNLLEFVHEAADSLESQECMDVIYMDMSKAFDKVSHTRLVEKLVAYAYMDVVEKLCRYLKRI